MSDPAIENQIAIACDLTVLTVEQREEHSSNTEALFGLVEEVRELSDGYSLRLPGESDVLQKAARFIQYERLCCPFFTFGIEVTAQDGPIWLSLSGGRGVKELIESGIISKLEDPVLNDPEP